MKICIIGSGTMGSGIARVFATAGDTVYLYDVSAEVVRKSIEKIRTSLLKLVEKGKLEDVACAATLARIKAGRDSDYKKADVVLEAVAEKPELKRAVFSHADALAPEKCVFATNTSSLSITEMAKGLSHPLVGMHFFNPAYVMGLVEVIRGKDTPETAFSFIYEKAKQLSKTPVEVKEAPGFVVNRILIPMINEAIGVLSAGTASAADIDTAMKLGANHPIGPLALGDLIGLDVVLS
ncbi:MAG: 3-hydroxybutyryl-CoA dehydrogenase, partial [Clostridia bacterium]|nr:3-hydroxybutyryl-CoA dehydrogenase [Clostridia bacterium]